jgi:hypothetical protein
MKESFKMANVAGIVVLSIIVFALVPLAAIWALNTVFPVLAIPMDFNTWLATTLLWFLISGRVPNKT